MTTLFVRSGLTALACAAAFALASPAMAATVNLKADLKAASEVPPTDSKGTGSATAAHFHAGEAGKNGGVAIPIAGADKGSFEGSATLTDAQADDLMGGKWYVNVHTAANKGGEVRGQVTK